MRDGSQPAAARVRPPDPAPDPTGAAILAALADGVVVTDARGAVVSVNEAFAELTGFDRAELIGSVEPYPWAWPDDADQGGPETLVRRRSGEGRPVLGSSSDLHDPDGSPAGRVLTFRDFTEQAIAAGAVREAEERFRTVFDDAPIGMAIISLRGAYLRANRRLGEMLGYAPEELAGMPVSGVTHPDDRESDRALLASLMAGEVSIDRRTKRYIAPGGRVVWTEITSSLVRGADGRPQHVVTQVRDVTAERTLAEGREAAEAALRASERRFRTLSEQAPVGIYETDTSGACLWANDARAELTGVPGSTALDDSWVESVHADDRTRVRRLWGVARATGGDFATEYRYLRADGSVVWVAGRATAVRDEHGRVTGMLGTESDVTRQREEQRARERAEATVGHAFEDSPIGVLLVAAGGRILRANAATARFLGRDQDTMGTLTLDDVIHPDDAASARAEVDRLLRGEDVRATVESRYVHASGAEAWGELSLALVRDQDRTPCYLLGHLQDVTARRRYESELRWLADHDPLTGLFNRRRLVEELERQLQSVDGGEPRGALLVLDLDHFKYVNDGLGRQRADELIVAVAGLLRDRLPGCQAIARLGGDEFAALLPAATLDEARGLAEAISRGVRQRALVPGAPGRPGVQLTASVGVTLIDDVVGVTAEDLLANAELAMFEAKEGGRAGVGIYAADRQEQQRMRSRMTWVQRIRTALDEGRFELLLQPIVDLKSGIVTQHEVLLRMTTEDGELVPPGAFLPVAERFGLIREIDREVARRAIRIVAERERAGEPVVLEVNLSGQSLGDAALGDAIARELELTGADPRSLIFEVTETAAVANVDEARRFAERLAALGCRFALDDFGAGFGSFYYLKHLPFDYLKIDGEFVRQAVTNPTDRLVIEAVVQVAHGLGTKTIAEFVEDEATLDLLRASGVDLAQGYHVGRPGPLRSVLGASACRAGAARPLEV